MRCGFATTTLLNSTPSFLISTDRLCRMPDAVSRILAGLMGAPANAIGRTVYEQPEPGLAHGLPALSGASDRVPTCRGLFANTWPSAACGAK
jgi:hypothetical protein